MDRPFGDLFGLVPSIPRPARRVSNDLDGLVELMAKAEQIVALTGAGISVASGLPDFRSRDGLWADVDPMKEASLSAWRNDPVRFWAFYIHRLTGYQVEPNPAHHALVELERMRKLRYVLTQNIDGLHQQAGNSRVVELHGSPRTVSCPACGLRVSWDEAMELRDEQGVPRDEHGHPLKPDIVLFEEMLPSQPFQRAHTALASADLLLCLGTSLVVHPVAGMPAMVRRGGADVVIITASETPEDYLAEVRLTDPLEEVLPAAVAALKERAG